MNYIIEDELDFKTEMEKIKMETCTSENIIMKNMIMETSENMIMDTSENIKLHTCTITQQPLTKSHIILPCSHKFNYIPLFNEVCLQKTKKNVYDTDHLSINQIKCPYCREISNNILPFIPSETTTKFNGVNYPFKYSMKQRFKCDWKNCIKDSYYIGEKCYCMLHYKKSINSKGIKDKTTIKMTWTSDMTKLYKSKSVIELKQILRINKLKVCGNKKELIERIFEKGLNIV